MLVELSVVEQRYLAVREALDTGATITDTARRYGVDRNGRGSSLAASIRPGASASSSTATTWAATSPESR